MLLRKEAHNQWTTQSYGWMTSKNFTVTRATLHKPSIIFLSLCVKVSFSVLWVLPAPGKPLCWTAFLRLIPLPAAIFMWRERTLRRFTDHSLQTFAEKSWALSFRTSICWILWQPTKISRWPCLSQEPNPVRFKNVSRRLHRRWTFMKYWTKIPIRCPVANSSG